HGNGRAVPGPRPWSGLAYVLKLFSTALFLSAGFAASALAQGAGGDLVRQPEFGARKVFFMLFLMLGPFKILVPFVEMTRDSDAVFRWRLATRSILFSMTALALAGLLGRSMLDNFNISLPVLALTGGVVLFLVALQTVLQQSTGLS